jgi:hypothetical protein
VVAVVKRQPVCFRRAFDAIALAPIFFWELSVGIWMTFKGFKAAALARLGFSADEGGNEPAPASPALAEGGA